MIVVGEHKGERADYAGREVRHLEDYFVAGRQAPTLVVVGTLVASLLSTNAFLGEVGMAYAGYGTLIVTLVAINVAGYVGGALFFGRHLRRSRSSVRSQRSSCQGSGGASPKRAS